jgi:CheY-like chemotaxis protein
MNTIPAILLVEDNPQDEMLTLRSLRKVNPGNVVDVVRDGQQALGVYWLAVNKAPPSWR